MNSISETGSGTELAYSAAPSTVDARRPMVQLRDLSKRYDEGAEVRSVIDGVNADIPRGEFTALAGPSGSGKTTLLNLISGIDAPTSGEVLIDSVPITGLSENDRTLFRRKNIGFVFQFFNLIPTLDIRENLLLPLQLNGYDAAHSASRVAELLERVGLQDRIDSYPDRLSGGEKQRVAIARALVHDPPLILADEPTGNLDADTGMSVLALLENLTRDDGKTLIVVSHSDMVVGRADRVLSMEDGQLIERVYQSESRRNESGRNESRRNEPTPSESGLNADGQTARRVAR